MVKPQVARFPLDFVQADIVKFHPPSQGCSYILVFEDRFSKFIVLYPLADKITATVAKRFVNFISRYGCPLVWGSDNGGEFKSKLIDALCRTYGTKKEFSLAYSPWVNGGCERKNRWIISELAKRVAQFGPNWVSQLPYVEFSYNAAIHRATGFSPFKLMYGREPRTPFFSEIPSIDLTGWDKENKNYFLNHQKTLELAQGYARENNEIYRKEMVNQSLKKGIKTPFTVGSQVWCFIPTEERHKLSLHYDGPWEIKKVIGNTV